jgi:HlyD family secretion protein
VSKVAQVATGNTTNGQGKKFDVEVTLTGTEGLDLKPNISAKAEIYVDTLEDVVFVPLQCVFLEGEQHYCHVMGPTGPERRKVKIGLSNQHFTQVSDGLQQGESVLLYNPNIPIGAGEKPTSAPVTGDDRGGSGGK